MAVVGPAGSRRDEAQDQASVRTYESTEDLRRHFTLIEGRSLGAALVAVDELGVVEPEEGEDGGVPVVDVEPVLDRVQPELVRCAAHPAPRPARARPPPPAAVR